MDRLRNLKVNIDGERLHVYFGNRRLGFLLSVLGLLFLLWRAEISYYLFLYVAGFIYIQLFFKVKWNWLRRLLVAPVFSVGALVVLSGFFDLAGIPIGVWCIYIVWAGALLVALVFPFEVRFDEIRDYRAYLFEIALSGIFMAALAARILPVLHEAAPILHDPEAHAYWAKDIIKSGKVRIFYSPGLRVNIALATLTTNATLARNTLMITHFFNAMISLSAGIFVSEFSKRKWWAILASAIFAFWGQPAAMYTAAGKNAFIFTTVFLFLTWTVVLTDIGRIQKIVLSNLILLATILSHYPIAFICCLGLGVLFLLNNNKKEFATYVIFALLVGLVWGGLKVHYQVEKLEASEYNVSQQSTIPEVLNAGRIKGEIKKFADSLIEDYLFTGRHYDRSLFAVGFLLMALLGWADRKYWFLPILWLLQQTLIWLGVWFRPVNPLWIVTSTQMISGYLFTILFISFPLSLLLFEFLGNRHIRYKIITAGLLSLVFFNGAFQLAKMYSEYQAKYHVVQQSDLDAFKWMTENLSTTDKILISARIHMSDVKSVVFAGDSGLWITVYTDFETSAPFEYTYSKEVFKNAKLYERFSQNPNDCGLRSKVLGDGFKYYFRGSNPAHVNPIQVTQDAFELIYENGPVKIYRILPCAN